MFADVSPVMKGLASAGPGTSRSSMGQPPFCKKAVNLLA